jgi:hypothetical protein
MQSSIRSRWVLLLLLSFLFPFPVHLYQCFAHSQTTIRLLGGLLSAYHLAPSQDQQLFLDLATDLGERLLGAFETPSGIPLPIINLAKRQGIPDQGNQGLSSLAEAASLQLELKYLSYLTGDNIFWKKAEKVRYHLPAVAAECVAEESPG